MEEKGLILRIERVSNVDGRGLRTVIFFKGCPLRCEWCSTPESQSFSKELYYNRNTCILCGQCELVCPEKAIKVDRNINSVVIDSIKCNDNYECVMVCPTNSLGVYGKEMTIEEIMKEIRKDEIFYYHSSGGVTLSGGSVLAQAEFARKLLIACKEEFINTSAELEMYGDYNKIKLLLPYLDTFFVDIKIMDSDKHKKWVGVGNEQILNNIVKASMECNKNAIHVRVPLIWNINDDAKDILEIAEFCRKLSNCSILEFLPYHRLGTSTYEYLNRDYILKDLPSMDFDEAYRKILFLKDTDWPFKIKLSGENIT